MFMDAVIFGLALYIPCKLGEIVFYKYFMGV